MIEDHPVLKKSNKTSVFEKNVGINLHPSFDNLSIVKKSMTSVVKSNVICRVRSMLCSFSHTQLTLCLFE
jgi:hypothetical protein